MKVELIGSIRWDGHHRDAGEVLDLSDFDAHTLISRGRAKRFVEKETPVINRAVELQTSDAPKTTKRRSYKKKTV